MLKITDDPAPASHRVLRLEGRIAGPWIAELREGSVLTLDLAGVSFVDRSGASLLHGLVQRRVALVGSTAFVTEQLHRENGSA